MLCSNSNSNWLDRLRSSKGFPISTDLDNLDQFLTSNPNPNPVEEPPLKPHHERRDHRSLFHIMTNVLSDLFVMGNPSNPNPIKSSRKQRNPRSHNGASSQSSANNSVAEGKKRKLKARKKMGGSDEGSKSKDPDLLGFSRTEVTVIDTSLLPDWKAARVVYRKGIVWKVKEKKGVRVRRRKKKKRKVGLEEKLAFKKEREKNEVGIKGEGRKVQLALLNNVRIVNFMQILLHFCLSFCVNG